MINILSAYEMKETENFTMNILNIPSPVLMERAALAAYNHITNNIEQSQKIIVFAGNGNNGGDGIAVARMLHLNGYNVDLCLIGNRDKSTTENEHQLYTFNSVKGSVIDFKNVNINSYDIIIDALLGIGISRNLEGDYLNTVNLINSSNGYVYSLDIPTGINTDTGMVCGNAVNTNETICFSEYKLGLLLGNAPEYTGKLYLYDVGIVNSDKVVKLLNSGYKNNFYNKSKDINFIHALTKSDISILLPKRPVNGHKGTFGKILVIAGSTKMLGAALLSSKAAFASGAGMVKLISSEINRSAILSCIPELMYEDSENISDKELLDSFDWADIVILGPGLSTDDLATHLVRFTLENANIPVIVDADALNIIGNNNLDLLKLRKEKSLTTIVTPHPGEFKKLFNNYSCSNPDDIKTLANEFGLIIVAKNAKTIISDGNETYINMSGTNGMGVAGSGDVLTGFIASILFNSKSNSFSNKVKSVALAVYLHGLAGEKAAIDKTDFSMTASDMIEKFNMIL